MTAQAYSNVPWPRVSVVIPTLNEARNLPYVFAQLPADVHEVIVVDGHSVDDTLAVARRLRPDVRIVQQTRKGKGNALACGFAAATGDVIAMIDADGSADPGEIPLFVKALLEGADFAKGTRFAEGAGSSDITRLRRLGNRALSSLVNLFYGTRYSDLCYGYNVFWRQHVSTFGLDATSPPPPDGSGRFWGDGFEVETLINIRAARAGLTVTEVPSFEHPRIHGESNLSTFSDGLRVLRTILVERGHSRRRAARTPPTVALSAVQPEVRAGKADQTLSSRPRGGKDPQPVARQGQRRERSGDVSTAQAARKVVPTVSVVIAAYTMERWDDLRKAVASAQAQTNPALETVVVIDHNPGLLARARSGLPPSTLVVPSTGSRGASGARNTGVAVTHGEVVAFIDDDAVASPIWLQALLHHFADAGVVGVGGSLDPAWDDARPGWFPPEFDWAVGGSYLGMPENAASVRNVWSNNMAIRRRVFDDIGGFRDGFGKIGQRSCPEDTDLCLRAAAHDHGTWIYEPAGIAAHRVPPPRATVGYFLARCFNEGRGKAALAALNGAGKSTSAERRYTRRVLPGGIGRGLRETIHGDLSGGSRSLAIAVGFSFTVAGFFASQVATIGPRTGIRRSQRAQATDAGARP